MRLFLLKILIAVAAFSSLAFAAEKVIYFTAGPVPSTQEKIEIAAINTQAAAPYTVAVRNSLKARTRASNEASTYVAGAIPPNYRDGGVDSGTPYATVYTYTNPPDPPALPSAQAILRTGQQLTIPGGGSVTVTVSSNTAVVTTFVKPDAGT
jgi:hypothetical protein